MTLCRTTLENPDYVFVSKHSTLPVMQQHASTQAKRVMSRGDDTHEPANPPLPNPPQVDGDQARATGDLDTLVDQSQNLASTFSPLWRPAEQQQDGMDPNFTEGDIFGLYNFAPDSTYYVDPFDLRFDPG